MRQWQVNSGSLETHVLTAAKIELSDFFQDHQRLAINKGESVKGEVIIGILKKKEIENDHNNKPRTKLYKEEVLTAWKRPGLNCGRHFNGKEYTPTRTNGALGVLRRIFDIAAEDGYRVGKRQTIFFHNAEPPLPKTPNPWCVSDEIFPQVAGLADHSERLVLAINIEPHH